MNKILVVDDEQNIRIMLKRVLSGNQYEVSEAVDGLDALKKLSKEKYDVIMLDLRMPKMDGLQVIRKLNEMEIDTPVVMVSAYGTVSEAVEAMKLGAQDYLMKPFDLDEMRITLQRIIRQDEIKNENQYFREEEDKRFNFDEIIGESKSIKKVLQMVTKVAPLPTTILLTGETGTGKELVARAIHKNSPRKDKPFIVANCIAFSLNILESELFGHEKGSFTGANSRRIGRFEMANKGTIFLDEIGEINHSTQAKLLRVVQEKEFERVGSSTSIKIDSRIITATNKDLKVETEKGNFREDLFYRLNVFHIEVPPLRERKEDIPLLVQYFIQKYKRILNKHITGMSQHAIDLLLDYYFPGNIRELENIIERAIIMCSGDIIHEDVIFFPGKPDIVPRSGTLKEMEKQMIKKYLIKNKGNRTKTALSLDISRRSLQLKIKEHDINI